MSTYRVVLSIEADNEEEASATAGRLASEGQGEITILEIEEIEEHEG